MTAATAFLTAVLTAAYPGSQQPPAAGADDIRGLHDAIAIPTIFAGDHAWLFWTLTAMAAAGIAAWVTLGLRRRRRTPSAADVARRALLDAERAMKEDRDHVRAAALLESAARDYLRARFGLPADVCTTREIALLLRSEHGHPLLRELTGPTLRLLHVCESAVFAREPLGIGEWDEMTAGFRDLIARREAELAAPQQSSRSRSAVLNREAAHLDPIAPRRQEALS